MSMAKRWVATFGYKVGAKKYAIVFSDKVEKAFTFASSLGLAEGAISISVALETDEHNIPLLDPEETSAARKRMHERMRAMRG